MRPLRELWRPLFAILRMIAVVVEAAERAHHAPRHHLLCPNRAPPPRRQRALASRTAKPICLHARMRASRRLCRRLLRRRPHTVCRPHHRRQAWAGCRLRHRLRRRWPFRTRPRSRARSRSSSLWASRGWRRWTPFARPTLMSSRRRQSCCSRSRIRRVLDGDGSVCEGCCFEK